MLKSHQYWIVSLIAAACLALVLVNIALVDGNRAERAQVESRAQYIQQSVQLQTLYQDMVKALAELAVRNRNDQLRDLLNREGINVTVTPPATSTAATPSEASASKTTEQ